MTHQRLRDAQIATEFVRLKVDVIVTWGTAPVVAAKRATAVIPIVFASCGPSGSWARPRRRLASAAAAGVTIEPVILDPGEFLVYCKAKNFSERGDRERNMFAREAMLGADFQW
jgi:hypothetical protein